MHNLAITEQCLTQIPEWALATGVLLFCLLGNYFTHLGGFEAMHMRFQVESVRT